MDVFKQPLVQVGALVGIILLGIAILAYIVYTPAREKVQIIDGALTVCKHMVFAQDPTVKGSKLLPRSNNQSGGVEFTYSWWMMVDNFEKNGGQTVFLKGYSKTNESISTYCPLVMINNENGENILDIRFNTYMNETERIRVENIPISKWFHCAVVVQRGLGQVYINGRLAKTISFSGVVRQNYGPLSLGSQGGFGGLISDLTYYSYALSPKETADSASTPPNKTVIGIDTSMPPYLSQQWFTGGGDL